MSTVRSSPTGSEGAGARTTSSVDSEPLSEPIARCHFVDCDAPVAPRSNLCVTHTAQARAWLDGLVQEGKKYERELLATTTKADLLRGGGDGAPRRRARRTLPSEWGSNEGLVPPPPAWHARAVCLGVDPVVFFPEIESARAVTEAKAICARCPVRTDCLADALEPVPLGLPDHRNLELLGVWGGLTTVERRALRTTRRTKTSETAA